ncbi:MAG: methionine synthase, partial [Acidimicrobiia bacterium]|nr:methionine synthase [Acidimicrobiia bacterium]
KAVRERVVIFDGGTGTGYQRMGLGPDDFGGEEFEGCNELLNITRPDAVASLHEAYLAVGVDVIETNTFGAFAVPLDEYGIAGRTYEIAKAGAEIARSVAADFSTNDRPRWVAGSIGPGTKFPSLGQIAYADLRDAYEEEARGLLDGGVDLFIIETMFDLLGLKAALNGARRAIASTGRQVPIQAQVTIEATGRMLPGTEIGAALAAVAPLQPDVFGLNCATGPSEMEEHLRHLSRHSPLPISVIPNAGLPKVVDGEMSYDLSPADLVEHHQRFVTELGISVIGGCCGTTPEHMKAVVDACAGLEPAKRSPRLEPGAASIYSFVPFRQDTSFLIVGERTNANGSKKFRDAMLAEDWDACVQVAKDQVRESAHMLDLCVDYVGRDGVVDMHALASRLATQSSVPLVLDSTEPEVMEAGLQWIGGRAVLNSANLEDGDGPGSRADRVFRLAKEYGAAVICLLIDEDGQARDVEWKMRIAHRLYALATETYGLAAEDLIFDALTFPLSTGGEDLRGDGIATINAIRRIKEELPGVFTVLGVSNVSFGLNPAARQVLNSVFLHECVAAGLDAAIVHAAKIIPLARIPEEQRHVAMDLVHDRRGLEGGAGDDKSYDPLTALLEFTAGTSTTEAEVEDRSGWTIEQRLEQRIIDGERDGLVVDLDEALTSTGPLDIVNDILLAGMKVVGDRFASGEMQLPFVLQSAETMKAAVSYLEPLMEKADASGKASIVLATVKGDVHDIGKNLVDIILTNNGYDVHNLGIKVGIGDMIDKAVAVGADAIGMSGLLVKSTLIMRDNLEELNRRGLAATPVILGGAALTRSYVEKDLRAVYEGPLLYGKDAFAGLRAMERIVEIKTTGKEDPSFGRVAEGRQLPERAPRAEPGPLPSRSPEVATDNTVFHPPFIGSRVVRGVELDQIAEFVNETALFRNQWQFRPEGDESDADFKARIRAYFRDQLAQAKAEHLLVPQVVYGYFAANADGDELVIWSDEERTAELARLSFPRQKVEPWLCIADFFRPVESGDLDYAAFHIVTMGEEVSHRTAELFAADKYADYLLLHGLGVEMAEALAEYWHKRIREEWGFVDQDGPSLHGLFRQQYRGGRYSWGYPACPDLADNMTVATLLDASRIGVEVTEETGFQYQPEQTTSAIIAHHPRAKYFIAR